MSMKLPANATDAELLYRYLGERLAHGQRDASVPDLLADFDEYRRQMASLRGKLLEAEEASARGEVCPLDIDQVVRRGRERAASRGIQ